MVVVPGFMSNWPMVGAATDGSSPMPGMASPPPPRDSAALLATTSASSQPHFKPCTSGMRKSSQFLRGCSRSPGCNARVGQFTCMTCKACSDDPDKHASKGIINTMKQAQDPGILHLHGQVCGGLPDMSPWSRGCAAQHHNQTSKHSQCMRSQSAPSKPVCAATNRHLAHRAA